MTTGYKQRCMTCLKEYDAGGPAIYAPLKAFDGWCICQECVDIYQKRKPAEKGAGH
jgi:hypothetical protein